MATNFDSLTDFGWQGIRLRVPDQWNLGRVDGNADSGYIRLDDAQIVRAEIEWRTAKRGEALPVRSLVDRYLENLEKKAGKAGLGFKVQRNARLLKDKQWLEGRDYEAFCWQADFQAHNLALKTHPNRLMLVRVLTRLDGQDGDIPVVPVIQSVQDDHYAENWLWSVFGVHFTMPADFKLESHELKSGHIKFNFERGKESCSIERLSMAKMLLKDQELAAWYPVFYKKKLNDLSYETAVESVKDHEGIRIHGRPRSRFRQLMRPLPWISARPRMHMHGLVWHCRASNKICVVDHFYRKKEQRGDFTDRIAHGYLCHQEAAEAQTRRHAQLQAGTQ